MKPPRLLAAVVVASLSALVSAACSKDDAAARPDASAKPSGPTTATCERVTAMSVCSEYSGTYLESNRAVLEATCRKLGGSFSSGACPNTAILGWCTLATGEKRTYYGFGGAAYDAKRAQHECETMYKGQYTPI